MDENLSVLRLNPCGIFKCSGESHVEDRCRRVGAQFTSTITGGTVLFWIERNTLLVGAAQC